MGKYIIDFNSYEGVNEAVEMSIRKQIIDAASKLDKTQQEMVAAFLKVAKDKELEAMAANLADGATTVTLEAAGERANINIPDIASDIVKESIVWRSEEELNEGFKDMAKKIGKAAMYILGSISLGTGILGAGSMFLQSKMAIFDQPVSGATGALVVYGGIIVAGLLFMGADSLKKNK